MLDTASSKVNGIMYVGDVRVANRNLLKYNDPAKGCLQQAWRWCSIVK